MFIAFNNVQVLPVGVKERLCDSSILLAHRSILTLSHLQVVLVARDRLLIVLAAFERV